MEERNDSASSGLVFTVDIPASIVASETGVFVARLSKKKHNIVLVPHTINAIKNAAVRYQKEKRLAAVQLTFDPVSLPAKLFFKWIRKKPPLVKPR